MRGRRCRVRRDDDVMVWRDDDVMARYSGSREQRVHCFGTINHRVNRTLSKPSPVLCVYINTTTYSVYTSIHVLAYHI
jgi:hypothetical protein